MKRRGVIGRAWRQMGEDPWLQAVAISTMVVALAIMGAYLALCFNLSQAAGRLLTGPTLLALTKPGLSKEEGRALAARLAGLPGVSSATYVDKQQAMERFRRQLGPQSELLDDLESNPLPNAVELVLPPDSAASPALSRQIKQVDGVGEVVRGRPWLRRLDRAYAVGGELALALGILLFLGVVLVFSNTVRLAVHARRSELEIMALVGAGSGYMRGPFLVEAMLQGLIAAALASLLLWGLFAFLAAPGALPWGINLGQILAFPPLLPPVLAGLAVLSGLLGGFLGVGRSLHPREVL
ncbi:cell division protein FtsX [Desulfoferula mesophila]|uniref:Cell division protein FtsX n=1 Tax=Desulfoferula mesophila TaxID=3058419 RepID=A0AAU9ECY9_9BACT|nr:hypothetical protein FAK_20820 [Desulfoferula mesophilus]